MPGASVDDGTIDIYMRVYNGYGDVYFRMSQDGKYGYAVRLDGNFLKLFRIDNGARTELSSHRHDADRYTYQDRKSVV